MQKTIIVGMGNGVSLLMGSMNLIWLKHLIDKFIEQKDVRIFGSMIIVVMGFDVVLYIMSIGKFNTSV